MKEYIERAVALNFLEKINPVDFGSMFDYKSHGAVSECLKEVRYGVEDIPAADVAEVRHGRWEYASYNGVYDVLCSACGYSPGIKFYASNYCPNCGARMDKEDNNDSDRDV